MRFFPLSKATFLATALTGALLAACSSDSSSSAAADPTGGGGTSSAGQGGGGTSAGGTSAGGTSAGGTSAGGTSAGGTSAGGTSAGAAGASTGGAAGAAGAAALKDIVDTAVAAPNFKTLVAAVTAADLATTLKSPGPFTVFAPTDDAFAKLPSFLVPQLTSAPYKTELGLILKYHVVPGKVLAADVLGKMQSVASVEGGKLSVDGSGGKVVINGGPMVIAADVLATNGVIHGIDGVLLPTIVDTAVGYDDGTTKFSTLVAAVTAADLVGTLSGKGPFTVFAPTDAAFAALKTQIGDAAFAAILADKPKLTKILTYHVVGAEVYSKDVTAGDVKTLEGDTIKLGTTGGVTVGDSTMTEAKVVLADLPNSNGVIHVIDKVLLPPGLLVARSENGSWRGCRSRERRPRRRFGGW